MYELNVVLLGEIWRSVEPELVYVSGDDARTTIPGVRGISSIVTASNASTLGVTISDELNSQGRSSETTSTKLVKTLSPRSFGGCLARRGLVLCLTRSERLFGGGE